jgi:alpha-tubulin suppressor-like RCC1 family protein
MKSLMRSERNFVALSCGRDHTLALLDSGEVFGWGGDGSGRIPASTPQYCSTSNAPTEAVEVKLQQKAISVAAGYGVSLGLTAANRIAVWGVNAAGIAGRLEAITPATPQAVAGLDDVRDIAAGEFIFGAINAAGNIYTWGLNHEGALGRPTAYLNAGPGLVKKLPPARQLALGKGHMLALSQDGRLFAWGNNGAGQLGLGHLLSGMEPQAERAVQIRFASIAAGATHSLGVSEDGKVYAWGSNQHGQLGHAALPYSTVPVALRLPEPGRAVAAGMHFSLALGVSGQVYAWGWNGQGQLGVGDFNDRRMPVPVPGLRHVRSIAAGETHAAAISSEGLFGWGNNFRGQLGAAERQQRRPIRFL